MNQEAPDTVLNEEWTLDPDGNVLHQLHFQADYAMTGIHLPNFPFDTPMIVATRRPFGVSMDELVFNRHSLTLDHPFQRANLADKSAP